MHFHSRKCIWTCRLENSRYILYWSTTTPHRALLRERSTLAVRWCRLYFAVSQCSETCRRIWDTERASCNTIFANVIVKNKRKRFIRRWTWRPLKVLDRSLLMQYICRKLVIGRSNARDWKTLSVWNGKWFIVVWLFYWARRDPGPSRVYSMLMFKHSSTTRVHIVYHTWPTCFYILLKCVTTGN